MQHSFEMECIFQRYESGIHISLRNNTVPSENVIVTQDSTADRLMNQQYPVQFCRSAFNWDALCNALLIGIHRSTSSVRIEATFNSAGMKRRHLRLFPVFFQWNKMENCTSITASNMASTHWLRSMTVNVHSSNEWTLTEYELRHVNMIHPIKWSTFFGLKNNKANQQCFFKTSIGQMWIFHPNQLHE